MATSLRELSSFRVEDSVANFVVIEHASKTAKEIAAQLAKRGVLVRDLSSYAGCDRCVRVSIGTSEANDAFLAAIREVA